MGAVRHDQRARKPRAEGVDRYVGTRLREQRMMLGLTQQQVAELIGVTYQQLHKYENGINRISAARLYDMACHLGVSVGYFFEGYSDYSPPRHYEDQRRVLDFVKTFVKIPKTNHQKALYSLVQKLAGDT